MGCVLAAVVSVCLSLMGDQSTSVQQFAIIVFAIMSSFAANALYDLAKLWLF